MSEEKKPSLEETFAEDRDESSRSWNPENWIWMNRLRFMKQE